MAAGFPAANNTFVPSFEASGKLQIEYSRSPKRFRINNYIKLTPVKKSAGYYMSIDPSNNARLGSHRSQWHDGQEAPLGNDNLAAFQFQKYLTTRYTYPFVLGYKTTEQADWDIIAAHARMAAQQDMTERTVNVLTTLTTAGNWGGNTDTATNVGGGVLDVSTTSLNYIHKAFDAVALAILKATYGVADRSDIIAVMNPNTAIGLAKAPETIDLLKQSPATYDMMVRNQTQFGNWGLPPELYGIKIMIEDAVKNTARKGATAVPTLCLADGAIVFVTRPEGLVGTEGAPAVSTVNLFAYEDQSVETLDDPNNRRRLGRVTSDYDIQLTAPQTGFYLTGCLT